jgi:hypothetical protein
MEPVPLVAVHFLSNQGFSAAADAMIMALHPERVKRCAVFGDVFGSVVVYVFPGALAERFTAACAERGLSAMRGVLSRHLEPRFVKCFDIGSAVISLAGPGAIADEVFVVTGAALPFVPPE